MKYYTVAANTPFNKSIISYSSDEEFCTGDLIKVPLGKRDVAAVVIEESEKNESLEYKTIKEKINYGFRLSKEYLDFLKKISNYYYYPYGMLLFEVLPKLMKRPKDVDFFIEGTSEIRITPNQRQQEILEKIRFNTRNQDFSQHLIHGVTGSGKTVIYLDLIREQLNQKKNVLFLLPEINLTPQFIKDLSSQLQSRIISYNSSLTDSEKYLVWKELCNGGGPYVVVGVRSSIFLPIENLGLIIVDEEHDNSFKQEDRCTYHARDVALIRGKHFKCPVVLGSATPSIETYFRFKEQLQEYYYRLNERANNLPMPDIEVIDIRNRGEEILSSSSVKKLVEVKSHQRQSIVYINRLGYSQSLYCSACGTRVECPNCSIALRYFKRKGKVRCSCCNYESSSPDSCKECGNLRLEPVGIGTERVLEELKLKCPNLSCKRFDRDELKNFDQVKEVLNEFSEGLIDVLVGTQMVTKGHNFQKVDNVIVLGIDSQLNFPDFRSGERVFQQVLQVAGRAGRFEKKGCVLIETLNKNNEIFDFIKNYRLNEYYDYELKLRSETHFPPFSFIAVLSITNSNIKKVMDVAEENYKYFQRHKNESIEVMRPRPAAIEKRVNKFSWVIVLRSPSRASLRSLLGKWYNFSGLALVPGTKLDIDPQTIN
ncbi:MAG: hypothetical protein Fur0010_06990 [Bdellovibrio sp.]